MGSPAAERAQERAVQLPQMPEVPTLIPPSGAKPIKVPSAEEMKTAVFNHLDDATIFIAAAAVADYRTKQPVKKKIKKAEAEMVLELEQTPDILSEVARARKGDQIIVGFAAETNDVLANAREK